MKVESGAHPTGIYWQGQMTVSTEYVDKLMGEMYKQCPDPPASSTLDAVVRGMLTRFNVSILAKRTEHTDFCERILDEQFCIIAYKRKV